jgi:hypothetical protein
MGIWDQTMWVQNVSGDLKYRVESALIERPQATPRGRVSFPSGRVREIADEILTRAGLDPTTLGRDPANERAAANAFRDHLQSFAYTMDIRKPPSGQDPIEWFLTDAREGHCEYFASAMAALCRSVGIGARVITGYVAAEWNETSRSYVVRESNAHAWVEVRDASGAYRTYDPTPPADLRSIHQPKGGLMARLRGFLDAINHAWVSRVVTFDQGVREDLMSRSNRGSGGLGEMVREVAQRSRAGGLQLALRAAFVGVITFGAITVVGLLVPRIIDRLRGTPRTTFISGGAGDDSQAAWAPGATVYERLLRTLAQAGCPKPAWSPPMQHVESLSLSRSAETPRRVVDMFYRARFGGQQIPDSELRQIEEAVAEFEAEQSEKHDD